MARRCSSWFCIFSFSRLILSLSFICSSVSEALFALSFSFLSESFFFLLSRIVEINNSGVTGQILPPKNDFENARGPRYSAYAANLTYDRNTLIYISREISIVHPSVGLALLTSLNDKNSCQLFRMGLRDKTTPTSITPLIRANMSCTVATIFFSLAFLSLSVSMANPSHLVAHHSPVLLFFLLLSPWPT